MSIRELVDAVDALAQRTTTRHAAITEPLKVGELLTVMDGLRRSADYGRRFAACSVCVCPTYARLTTGRSG